MAIAFRTRGKVIFNSTLSMVKKEKRLLIIPLINITLTLIIMLGMAHPLITYEKTQWSLHHLTAKEVMWFYIALLSFLFIRNVIDFLFNAALVIAIQQCQQGAWGIKSVWAELKPKSKTLFLWITAHSFTGVYLRIYSALISNTHPRRIFGGSSLNKLHLIIVPLLIDKPQSFLKKYTEEYQ